MADEQQQNLANHPKVPTTLLVLSGGAILVICIAALSFVYAGESLGSYLLGAAVIVLALLIPGCGFMARIYALTLQDRIIRLEMRVRLEQILPDDLRGRSGELTLPQLIALRFASDAELPELVRRVLDGSLTERQDIKKNVSDWQPDYQRV